MKIRRVLVFLIAVSFCGLSLFSVETKYYPVASNEWKMVDDICRIAGVSGPSSFGPVTGNQLLIALDRAEKNMVSYNLIQTAR